MVVAFSMIHTSTYTFMFNIKRFGFVCT